MIFYGADNQIYRYLNINALFSNSIVIYYLSSFDLVAGIFKTAQKFLLAFNHFLTFLGMVMISDYPDVV